MITKRLTALWLTALIGTAAHAATDTVDNPSHGYTYRPFSYAHSALPGSFATASLRLTAFDIDAPDEVDTVYGWDTVASQWLLLGPLLGADNLISATTFTLPAALFDDIGRGLQVKVDVSANAPGRWGVTVESSQLGVAAVPEPGTWLMLLAGSAAGASIVRRRGAR